VTRATRPRENGLVIGGESSKCPSGFVVNRFFFPPTLLLALTATAFAACGSTTATTGITPITGIVVRSDALVTGLGCGTAPSQVFKYAVIVSGGQKDTATGQRTGPSWGGVYDCFADATFVNLYVVPGGGYEYNVTILAFNADAYAKITPDPTVVVGRIPEPPDPSLDAGDATSLEENVKKADDAEKTLTPQATWSTTCTATQQSNIQVLADCKPLVPIAR
jgi:hypothetical protein